MRGKIKGNFRKGAASFYIVAFSTLILVIVAMSFAAIVVSEMTRTSNDDLSQSAYDSALAGIEDAKIAIFNYRNCVANGTTGGKCESIRRIMEGEPYCGMVGEMLGRESDGTGAIPINESKSENNRMEQFYTCVKINNTPPDYRSNLSEANPTRIVRVKLDDSQKRNADGLPITASDITKVKVSWYADSDGAQYNFTHFLGSNLVFQSLDKAKVATPPMISVQLIQTAEEFKIEDFTTSIGDRTDRGIVYLVPSDNATWAAKTNDTYMGVYNSAKGANIVKKEELVKSNDKTAYKRPYAVYCNKSTDEEFLCSTYIELPKPVGGDERSNETFMFIVSVPYGQPSTDFALEFFCGDDGTGCAKKLTSDDAEETTEETTNRINIKDVQISIDSTGRANDLYRRVETRMETADTNFPFPLYAIQLFGKEGDDYGLNKDLTVTKECNFLEVGESGC